MPHIHKLIDFTVSCYIVYQGKVLLAHHKKLNKWLPVGGHVELDEDTDQALRREVEEETGLEVEFIDEIPDLEGDPAVLTVQLRSPRFMDIHNITSTHRHINLVFFGRAKSDQAILAPEEHHELKWFSREELSDPHYELPARRQFYATQALSAAQILDGSTLEVRAAAERK